MKLFFAVFVCLYFFTGCFLFRDATDKKTEPAEIYAEKRFEEIKKTKTIRIGEFEKNSPGRDGITATCALLGWTPVFIHIPQEKIAAYLRSGKIDAAVTAYTPEEADKMQLATIYEFTHKNIKRSCATMKTASELRYILKNSKFIKKTLE